MPRTTPYAGLRYPLPNETSDIAAQTQNLATDLDTACNTRDATRSAALKRARASISRPTGSQNVAKGSLVTLTGYTVTDYDTASMANAGTGILTCQQAGLYYVSATAGISNSGTGTLTYSWVGVSRNNSTTPPDLVGRRNWPSSDSLWQPTCCGVFLLALTDTLRVMVAWSGSGAGPTPVSVYQLSATLIATNP